MGQGSSLLTAEDLHLFNEGSHFRLYEKLGAHPCRRDAAGASGSATTRPGSVAGASGSATTRPGSEGTFFAVWAPDAEAVCVTGDFNGWNRRTHPLSPRESSGVWEGFVPGVGPGALYKFHVASRYHGHQAEKADPFAFLSETPPKTASVVWDLAYDWCDAEWMAARHRRNALDAPMAVYEVHLGSWMRLPESRRPTDKEAEVGDAAETVRRQGGRPLTYRELASRLTEYVRRMGFTHVEFLPMMEHPFYGSWGYQMTGYFAPTSRYGTPQDFMALVDCLHQNGIGVILDWVPSHFANDPHGLGFFDGTHLYEHADSQKAIQPDWNSYIFNYGREEVRSFLISSGLFWLDKYHADGLRVDAVASMLYLDYSRGEGQWIPNRYGGKENLEAIRFLRRFNEEVYARFPDVQTIAEESTAWGAVSRPTTMGGLGFGMKWDMGWMHDTLDYITKDPVHRRHHHSTVTFRMLYAFTENFVLPLSHDEVVHGKASLLAKMPGDDWQKFANLRLLLGYQYAQPGKKLLFMGAEFGQWREWQHEESLDWHLTRYAPHRGLQKWVEDLNRLYRQERALHDLDFEQAGFEWVVGDDADNSVLGFLRRDRAGEVVLVACNFTPVPRVGYRIGAPRGGTWRELLNSDGKEYGGSGWGNFGRVEAEERSQHGRSYSLTLSLPPLAIVFLKG